MLAIVWWSVFSQGQLKGHRLDEQTNSTAANMNKFGELLEERNISHVCCADHEMHNTCKKVFNKNLGQVFGNPHASSWEKARCHIHHFNHSSQALEKLKEKQVALGSEAVGIVDEVVTRWWASFDAAERMIRLKLAIEAMHFDNEIDQEKCPELLIDDWH